MHQKSAKITSSIKKNSREILLKSAIELFATHGYHASSISLIAKRAGLSKGLTYHYFENKEALLVALVELRLQEWLPLTEGLESIKDPGKRLSFLIDFVLGELVEKCEKLRFYNSLYLHADGVRAIEIAMEKYQTQFNRLFQAERKLYVDLGFSDPDMEATFLRSTLQGISLEYMLGPKDYPLETMKQMLLNRYRSPMMQSSTETAPSACVQQGRYQFYREHKYVSFVLNDLERLIARTDFRLPSEVARIEQEFHSVVELLRGHAEYEDGKLHPLLQAKGSNLFQKTQEEHAEHDSQFQTLQELLDQIKKTADSALQVVLGYRFYLNYRHFVGENLHHLHEEETLILPELQKLYSDAELRTVEAETYQQMSVEELVEMMQLLFPHFNSSDREAFLIDIQEAVPEKFTQVWEIIKKSIDPKECDLIRKNLNKIS